MVYPTFLRDAPGSVTLLSFVAYLFVRAFRLGSREGVFLGISVSQSMSTVLVQLLGSHEDTAIVMGKRPIIYAVLP